MEVWFIDDRADNRATWLASFPTSVHQSCTLRTFETVPGLLAALDAGERPDIVFVDFFIKPRYGFEVIERLSAGEAPCPLIIAHSSMRAANDGMLRAGAHLAMEKVKGVPVTESIQAAISGPEDLRRMLREHLD